MLDGVPMMLGKIRSKRFYKRSNNAVKRFTNKVPFIGKPITELAHHTKRFIKGLILKNMFFEDIGFTYLGPVDGHDIEKLEKTLKTSRKICGPVLIHVVTKKGKGYEAAECHPDKFHGASAFDIETGCSCGSATCDYSAVFGNKLVELAKKDKKIVAITAAMKDGTGLTEFASLFPHRFFDIGITEGHGVGLAAGMAKAGLKPVFAVYSSFLQRGYDQLIHDIAIQKIPAIFCLDRAGIVGADGETHQGIFDLSYLSTIPNINIMAPKNFMELEKMMEFATKLNEPVAIRYPRGNDEASDAAVEEIALGKAEVIKEGKDISIIAIGKMVKRAEEVAALLSKEKIDAEIINVRFLKPLDVDAILKSVRKTKKALRESLAELLIEKSIQNITVRELTDKADVHRSTFYANFNDIYDLYNQTEDFVIQEVSEILSVEHDLDARTFFSILLQYIIDNKQVCRLILTGNINGIFINRISILFKGMCVECWKKELNLKCSDKELDYYAQFFLSGSMGVIGEWVVSNFECSVEEIMLLLANIDYGFGTLIKSKLS